jgi:hypothetical protein
MHRVLALILVLCSSAAIALPAFGALPVQSRRVAEVRVLRSAALLARWQPSMVDKSTGLVRSNVLVRCTGTGKTRSGRYHTFRCIVAYGHNRLAVSYVARPRGTCLLTKIRTYRV